MARVGGPQGGQAVRPGLQRLDGQGQEGGTDREAEPAQVDPATAAGMFQSDEESIRRAEGNRFPELEGRPVVGPQLTPDVPDRRRVAVESMLDTLPGPGVTGLGLPDGQRGRFGGSTGRELVQGDLGQVKVATHMASRAIVGQAGVSQHFQTQS